MKKCIHKKILIIVLLIMVFITIYGHNRCLALSDITDQNNLGWLSWSPKLEDDEEFIDKAEVIISLIRTLGIIISVGSLSFIGLKILLGSIEEKANYKQKMVPWIVGAVMVFAITVIPTTIYDITNDVVNRSYRK